MTAPISATAANPIYVPKVPTTSKQQQIALWSQVGKDLNTGNLSGAQTAFAGLKSIYDQNHTSSDPTNGPLTSDLQNLSQALSSGSLSASQAAFTQLGQDARADGITGSGSTTPDTGTTGSQVNVLA